MNYHIAILAGGKSSRMKRDKRTLPLGGRSMLQTIQQTARSVGPTITVLRDVGPSAGPLSGIATAFATSAAEGLTFLSCDMPFVTEETVRRLQEVSGRRATFTSVEGVLGFPFCLPRASLRIVEKQIGQGELSLQKLAQVLGARAFQPGPSREHELLNVNTPPDYKRAVAMAKERAEAIIDIDQLTIRRGTVEIISDLCWRVKPGEHWAILGANGSGKTSLLSAITGYLTPTAGRISVLGQTFGESDWRQLRKQIGIVSSSVRQLMPEGEPAIYTVISGKDAVIDYWGKARPQDRARARKLLRQVECEYLAERPWAVLSQGERQRVLIGRALMNEPALLILDEPCAGLDPAAREHFLQFLERLGGSENAPSLALVTHHVEEIVPQIGKAMLLKDGEVLAAGDKRKTLTNELLSQTFSADVRLFERKNRFFLEVSPSPRKIT